ncbi:MAG TPA: S26 family signal peptidase [Thermoplasmata archaeon]|nr:S26 family signal peptidase [Thermoplasmata archaeon]
MRSWGVELLVAVILILLLLGPPFIYAGGWPPVVSVESPSMEHGSPGVGTLDVGDLVIIKRVASANDVVTYAEGRATGHSTFGEFGDVILFNRPAGGSPIIHRAILWLDYDQASGTWNAPELLGLANGRDWSRSDGGASPTRIPPGVELRLLGVRTAGGDIAIALSQLDPVDGFITKGDNIQTNRIIDQHSTNIAPRHPIEATQLVGVARGELPCVGLVTLAIIGKTQYATSDHATCAVLMIALIVFIGWVGHTLVVKGVSYARVKRRKSSVGEIEPSRGPALPPPSPTQLYASPVPEGRRIAGASRLASRRSAARRAAQRRPRS